MQLNDYQIKFLMECGIIRHNLEITGSGFVYYIQSDIFEPSVFSVTTNTGNATFLSALNESKDFLVDALLNRIGSGTIKTVANAECIYKKALKENKAKEFEQVDGAIGIIRDVSEEDWYQNYDIEIYDEIEADAYALACKCAEFIGVSLSKESVDFSIAKQITEATMNALEKAFGVKFPV